MPETINNIDQILQSKDDGRNVELAIINISHTTIDKEMNTSNEASHFSYEFSKLFEKHPIFNIEFFKRKFYEDELIMQELVNMERNVDNRMEYYCSYEYLEILFKARKYL